MKNKKIDAEKNRILKWIKAHKNQLILAGVSVAAVIGLVLVLKDRKALAELWAALKNILKKPTKNRHKTVSTTKATPPEVKEVVMVRSYTPPKQAFEVSQHVRNLPGGKHHSMEKAAEAAKMGIELLPNQTLVDSYTKYAA